MKIEAGKYYRTRDGRKVGPMEAKRSYDFPFGAYLKGRQLWDAKGGRYCSNGNDPTDLIAEWTDTPEKPVTWGEMTDAEKGALLLAHHEGAIIQYWRGGPRRGWADTADYKPIWDDRDAYRVRPPEPVRSTVAIAVDGNGDFSEIWQDDDTCRITFPALNCEIPTGIYTNEDGESIVVERVND